MHHLILGMMRHGKTTGALELARSFKRKGIPVAVYTVAGMTGQPKDGERWRPCCDFITTKRSEFLAAMKAPGIWGWQVFIDEANQTVGKYDPDMEAIATDASSHALTMHFIAQRGQTFNRTVREQCSSLTMFRLGPKDCKELSEDWGQPDLERGYTLKKFEYIHCTTELGSVRRGRANL